MYLEWVLEAWYDGVTKDNVINFKACGIGSIGGADDHLIHRLKEGSGIPNGLYDLTKHARHRKRRSYRRSSLYSKSKLMTRTTLGHVSDVEVVDDESAASGEEDSGTEDENHDDSDF